MAHLKAYVPNFPKHMWKRSQCRKLWVLALSEVGWSRIVGPKNAVFSAFFERKCSLTAKPSIFDPIVLHIFRKLSIWGFRKSGWNSIFDILWSVRFLGTGWDRYVPISRDLVISPNLSCCLLLSIDVSTSHSWNRWPSASIWFILDHFPGLIRHPSPKALSMNFFLHFVTILMFLEIILYPTSVSKGVV